MSQHRIFIGVGKNLFHDHFRRITAPAPAVFKIMLGRLANDVRTNSLIVKDTIEVIDKIRKIIETLDTQTPQILIESKIVEASEKYEFRAGLENGISLTYDPLKGKPAGSECSRVNY